MQAGVAKRRQIEKEREKCEDEKKVRNRGKRQGMNDKKSKKERKKERMMQNREKGE